MIGSGCNQIPLIYPWEQKSRIVIQFHLESYLVYEKELNFSFTLRLALLKLTCLVHFVKDAARVGMERVRSTQNECND